MFTKLKTSLSSFGLALLTFLLFCTSANSKNFHSSNVTNSQIMSDIEKSLMFDKESKEAMNFYSKDKSIKEINVVDQKTGKEKSFEILVIDQKPNAIEMRKKEKLAYNSALVDQDEVALELFKQILEKEPDNKYVKFSMAVIYQKLGQFQESKNLYHKLLQENPDNSEQIISNLFSILIDESPKEALYLLERLAKQNPKSSEILAKAALAYEKLSDRKNAIKSLERAINLDPKTVEYKYNLAVMYDKNNQLSDAFSLYSEVISMSDSAKSSISISDVEERRDYLKKIL
jgi:tetratricopeptide (TPR) repeat protein